MLTIIVLALIAFVPAVAQACLDPGCPCGPNSTFEPYIAVSPVNDDPDVSTGNRFTYSGILRNDLGAPIANWSYEDIWLDFSDCGGPSEVHPNQNSDANGNIVWDAASLVSTGGGWGADPSAVYVKVPCASPLEGIVLYTIVGYSGSTPAGGLRCPDYDGNGFVGIQDLGVFQNAYSNDGELYLGDFDRQGDSISIIDLGIFQDHYTAE